MGQPATNDRATVTRLTADHTRIKAAPTFIQWCEVVDMAADTVKRLTEGER